MVCDQIKINSIVKEGVLQFTIINNSRSFRMAPRLKDCVRAASRAAAIGSPKQEEN
jgi:hypothetical protein